MASTSDNFYVTFVDVDRDLLKVWGQRSRVGATYIERQLLQLVPEFNRTQSPPPSHIHKGMFCFAKYTDDNYYRARVISGVQGESVGVLFVDYGNKDIINISNIRIQEGAEGDVLAKMAEQAEEYYLAKIKAPSGGWTKKIVSEIRRDICYDEFICQTIAQVGDQKVLEIKFHNEDFSNYLVKKHFASPISLQTQQQMILSYCSLVSNDPKQSTNCKETSKENFPAPLGIPGNFKVPSRISYMGNETRQNVNFDKQSNSVNYSQPFPPHPTGAPPLHVFSKHENSMAHGADKNNPGSSYYNSLNHPALSDNFLRSVNPGLNALLNNQYNPLYQMKGNVPPMLNSFNKVMVEALAKQIKQYITEDNVKSDAEKIPHHYVNSVLEVGKTYSIFVSCIDDGPWSFSVRLLSSESELEKLISDLETCELVNIKPPIILGHPCIGLSEYGNYCRGVIVSVSRSAVKVYFVDFGNTEDLPVSSIFELPPKFFKTRVLSQKFCLSGLNKVAYSEDIKTFFAEVVQDKLLMLKVISLEDDNLPTCELYLKDKNIKRILNEKMQELKTITQEEFPKVGESENVVVTWVVSPLRFYIQLRKKDPELNELKKELFEVQNIGQPIPFQEVTVGLKCVCHYETDGQWYRAMVTAIESENEITVFYIDYGNTEKVGISRLRKVNNSGLINQMCAQAIQCSLKGFENKSFDQDLSDKLEALILEKDLKMTVVSSDKDQICVELFENGNNITSFLTTETSLKTDRNSYISQKNENVWRSPVVSDKKGEVKFERKNKGPETSVSPEKKENAVSRGDKNREKINSLRRFQDIKNNKSQFRSTHIQLKKRWEDGNRWRDGSRNSEDHTVEKFKVVKDKKPFENQKFLSNRGSHQSRSDKKEEFIYDKKRHDGVKSGKSRFDNVNKGLGVEPQGRRIEKRNQSWDNSRRSDGEVRKRQSGDRNDKSVLVKNKTENKLLESIKKEDIAPPGSKFEEITLELGSSEKGIVTFYFNPSEFYVQLLTQEDEFKRMMQDIQNYYHDKQSLRDPVKTGDIVIAQFSLDKILYRAEVVKPSPVTVLYVDYGNLEPVAPKCIWPVDKKFLKLPKQVIKCRLSKLQPIGSEWPPPGSHIDSFFEMEEYKCTFLNFQEGTYEISMENLVNHLDVAREIISAGLGKPIEPHIEIPVVDYTLLPNQILRLYVSHVISFTKFYVILNSESATILEKEIKAYTDNKENLTSVGNGLKTGTGCLCSDNNNISWYRGLIVENKENNVVVWLKDRGDTVEIPADKVKNLPDYLDVFQPQAIECYLEESKPSFSEEKFKAIIEHRYFLVSVVKTENQRLSTVLYSERGEKLNFQTAVSAPQIIEPISCFPLLSQKLRVAISHADSPKEIYIQRLADSEALNSLSKQLSDFYSEKKDLTVSEETVLVAAKSVIFEKWCRGRVLSTLNDAFDIFYIDYGSKETLPIERVKRLDDSFIKLNALSIKVGLNINLDNTEELKESWKNLMNLVQGKELTGYFINNGKEILAEFILDGERLTPLLKVGVPFGGEDKFQKFFPDKEMILSKDDAKSQVVNSRSLFELKVFVSHIDSPEQFWVHKETEINDLHQFQDKLQKLCENLPDKKNIQLGDTVAALFSDMWYRAKVINVEKDIITVQFIDYGNTIDVDLNYEKVKELTSDIINMASFATCYSLKGNWFADATSKFEEIILQHEDPVGVEILEEGNPSVVDLFQNGQSIREQLMNAGVGLEGNFKEESELCTVYITHYNSPDDFYVQKESCTDSLVYISEGLVEAESFENATGVRENEIYAAKFPDDGIWYRAKVIKKRSDCYEVLFIDYGNTSDVTEVKLLPDYLAEISGLAENYSLIYGNHCDTWSEAACQKFSEFADGRPLKMKVIVNKIERPVVKLYNENVNISKELEALSENDGRSEVYVTHALSPVDFFIQYVDDDDYKLILETIKNGNEKCESLEDKTPGSLCLAVFSQDGLWYRGKILQNLDEGCEIFFLDFGNISISTELKKLPPEIENIPPKALRCALNLKEKNIQESVKEEFINLTAGGDSVFRVRIITPGDINIVSLKLDGVILEETLTLNTIPMENTFRLPSTPTERDFPSLEDETDDDKKSKINISTNNYLSCNLDDSVRVGGSIRNETDEEKRVKIAIGDVASEGFKSDDEKGISEGSVLSSIVNVTDNELIEEYQDNNNGLLEEETEASTREGSLDQSVSHINNTERGLSLGETIDSNDKTEKLDVRISETDNREMKIVRNEADEIVPGSVCQEEPSQNLNENHADSGAIDPVSSGSSFKKTPAEDEEAGKETGDRSLSSPTTASRNYLKKDEGERIVPGCISSGVPLKGGQDDGVPLTDSIVPERESESVTDK